MAESRQDAAKSVWLARPTRLQFTETLRYTNKLEV